MPPSGLSLQEVYQAIVDGYSRDELRRVVSACLHENYDLLVSPEKPYVDQAFDFVQWAERQGRLQELAGCLRRARPTPEPGEPPYKGLAYFGVADAALFFGRETLVAELVAYLKDHRFLAVVGASGSGKSSAVRAGVVPALQQGEIIKGGEQWAVHILTPTVRPLQALAAELTKESESVTAQATLMDDMARDARSLDLFASRLLARTGAPRLLLVVDQFEELFTLCKDHAEQQAYLDNLLAAAAPDGVTTVILTLRADFYGRCAEFANLRAALQDYQKYIGPMSPGELRTAIERPAQQNGWEFEPGLVDAILADVEGEAGSLPLLSHALLETWKRRSGRLLTFAGYHAAGGVQGAIAKTADGVYAELPPEQQAIARSIFLRLTTLGEGTQDTRRRAPLPELLGKSGQAAEVQAVLKRLEDERLVTAERATVDRAGAEVGMDEVYVDVTHEALIRAWPRLAMWLNEDREGLLVHRRLTEAAQEWQEMNRDAGALFRGARLAQAAEWAAAHDGDLNELEHEFLNASRRQATRSRLILGFVTGAIVALLLLALGAAVYGFISAQERLAVVKPEELLTSARDKRDQLDVNGAIADFYAAAAAASARGKVLDVSGEITDTLRYVATAYVQEGERILCEALYDRPEKCELPIAGQAVVPITTSVVISQPYLVWAQAAAPQIVGWSSYKSTEQQAVISATALYSQALALHPPSDTPVYVWIAPGSFEMGSTVEQCEKAGIGDCPPDEQPLHPIELDGYWLQRTEITNEQYKRCVEAGGCPDAPQNPFWQLPRSARLPVTYVTWNQASAYAAWVGGRLPTEAEWEYACRGGDGRIYSWGDEPPARERLNFNYDLGGTTEVGTYPSGANHLYDMAGNVYEWTADRYGEDYYKNSPKRNPIGPNVGAARTLRGGAWGYGVIGVRCAVRDDFHPDDWNPDIGFRLVSPG